MNLYILVEGRRTEKKVYRSWLSFAFPQLTEVSTIEEVSDNQFFILAGLGYPQYVDRMKAALQDIAVHGNIDHFFVCVDSEDMQIASKIAELQSIIDIGPTFSNSHLIVHNCCFETWFLGHTQLLRKNPSNVDLLRFKAFYDVSVDDPEQMNCPKEYETKAQYHFQYLRAMFQEQHLTYSKERPGCTVERHYFDALVARYTQTSHISSFGHLLNVWRRLGGNV